MAIYIDPEKRIVNDGDSYVSSEGVQYPPEFPKLDIPGLLRVIETQRPIASSVRITGFYVDESNHQVWQTEEIV